jgi:hypothetical protein
VGGQSCILAGINVRSLLRHVIASDEVKDLYTRAANAANGPTKPAETEIPVFIFSGSTILYLLSAVLLASLRLAAKSFDYCAVRIQSGGGVKGGGV